MWVLSTKHLAASHQVPLGEASLQGIEIALELAGRSHAEVVHGDGTPGAGALVVQSAQLRAPLMTFSSSSECARAVLFAEFRCDDSGKTPLYPFEGETRLVASSGAQLSPPWTGLLPSAVTLRLGAAFTAAGHVAFEVDVNLEEPLAIVSTLWRGHLARELGRFPVAPSGGWGPVALPLLEGERLEFRLDGANAQPDRQFVELPEPGAELWFEHRARAGYTLWAFVGDQDEAPIPTARVELTHTSDAGLSYSIIRPVFAEGDWSGYARFDGLSDGNVDLSATALGYARRGANPLRIPTDLERSWVLRLVSSARLEGRVTQQGEPVSDFEICFWSQEKQEGAARRVFHDREDGTFLIEDTPREALSILATSIDGRGPAVSVDLSAGTPTSVELEIEPARTLVGRVVDVLTNEPIASASVQVHTSKLDRVIAPWGSPRAVDEDGGFEMVGLIPGRNTVEARAPGYTGKMFDASLDGAELDVGVVTLSRTQELRVQLVGKDGQDYSGYRLGVEQDVRIAGVPFDANGLASVEAAPAGPAWLSVVSPEGFDMSESHVYLTPGRAWRIEIPVDSASWLQVEAISEVDEEVQGLVAFVYCRREGLGPQSWRVGLDGEGRGVVHGVPVGDAFVVLTKRASGERMGSAVLSLVAGLNVVSIPVSSVAYPIQVVDDNGEGIASAELHLDHPRFSEAFFPEATDANGLLTLRGFSGGDYIAHLTHSELGFRSDVPLRLDPENPKLQVLSLIADGEVSIAVRDASGPVQGARCSLYSLEGSQRILTRTSDSQGNASWAPISAGPFRLLVKHPRYWPTEVAVSGRSPGGDVTDVRLAGVGNLRVHLRGAESPLLIELEPVGREGSVAEWLRAQRITSSTGALMTAVDGGLLLVGLPEGEYTWTVSSKGLRGSVAIEPGSEMELELILPD